MEPIEYDLNILRLDPNHTPVTVIVTCHNYGPYLAQCLSSIIGQNFKAARIVLMDDASTDDTPEIALSFPDIEYVRVEYRDVCATRDHALKTVTTPWVLFVDADNWLQFRYLELLYKETLSCDRNIAAIYPSKRIFGRYDDVASAEPYEADRLDTQSFFDMCSLIRTSALREVGGWNGPMRDVRGASHDDWALWLRLRSQGWSFKPCPNALLMYRTHGENCSSAGVMQAPNTIIRHARFTLLTIMSGRHWNLNNYLNWLARMDCVPEQVELFILDNSNDKAFGQELRYRLALQERFTQYRYVKVDRMCDPEGLLSNAQYAEGGVKERLQRDPILHGHVAALYAHAFSQINTDFIFCVEDDIIPDDTALYGLIEGMAWRRSVGAVGGVVNSRLHTDRVIAGSATSLEVYTKDLGTESLPMSFVSAGCVLYRTSALKICRPRYEVLPTHNLFWDVSIGQDMAEEGWETLLNPKVRTRHYSPDGSYL